MVLQKKLIFAFIFMGSVCVISQTLFIRELLQIFYGNELSIGIIFSGWLIFSGIGSFIGRKIKQNIFYELLIGITVILVIEFYLVHSIRDWIKIGPGELVPLFSLIIFSFFIFSPIALLLGLTFVQCCKLWAKEIASETKGALQVYMLDAFGDTIGGFLFAFLLVYLFSLKTLFIIGIVILILVFILAKKLATRIISIALSFVIIITFFYDIEKIIIKKTYSDYKVENYTRSIYSNLVLIKSGSLYSVFANGMFAFSYPLPQVSEEIVHISFLQVKEPKIALIIEGSPELVFEALKYPVNIDWVSMDKKVLSIFGENSFPYLNNPQVNVIWCDPRKYIKFCKKKYDVIIMNASEPMTYFTNRFYTYEFFREIKKTLNPSGVFSFGISSNPNYLSEEMKKYNATIYWTLKKVFDKIIFSPGEEIWFYVSYASNYLTDDADSLFHRFHIHTTTISPHYLYYKFQKERINYIKNILENYEIKKLNTDAYPISFLHNVLIFSSFFSQKFNNVFLYLLKFKPFYILLIILFILFFLGLFTRSCVFSVGCIGAINIATQLIIIISFESIFGYVYHKIGIITGVFMLGISFGTKFTEIRGGKLPLFLFFVIIYVIILLFIINLLLIKPLTKAEPLFYLLPLICGFLGGCVWSSANKLLIANGDKAEKSAGLLNGVDLICSAISSFVFSLFFIPIYGIYFSLALLLAISFISFLFSLIKR